MDLTCFKVEVEFLMKESITQEDNHIYLMCVELQIYDKNRIAISYS